MNKLLKKYLSILLLGIFTCNTVIVLKLHTMAIPIQLVQQVPRALMFAGACIISIWRTKTLHPVNSIQASQTKTEVLPSKQQAQVISSIAANIKPNIERANNPTVTRPQSKGHTRTQAATHTIAQPKTTTKIADKTIDDDLEKVAHQIASHEEQKLILRIPRTQVSQITFPIEAPSTFKRIELPNGVLYSANDGEFTFTINWSDRQAHNENEQSAAFRNNIAQLRRYIQGYPHIRTWVTQQLKDVAQCLRHTQSHDLIERIQACYALRNLHIVEPLTDNLLKTINKLEQIFFHADGTLCHKALNSETLASDHIVGLINWFDYHIGDIIPRSQYISQKEYNHLNPTCSSNIFTYIWRWFKSCTGYYCSAQETSHRQTQHFNKDLWQCIDHCAQFKFHQAEQLRDQYNSKLFNEIIHYYKNIQINQDKQQKAAIYDNHGIIRIAHNDPLYKQCSQQIEAASKEQKHIINENLLVRHHIKTIMHEHWNIPESAPTYVHEALYAIMGQDCSALSDITLLQERIEQIVNAAPTEQRAKLIEAFYMPNGILKEYAQHDINVQAIKMPESILDAKTPDTRHLLNTLVGLRIKNPQESAKINSAIECLQSALKAKTAHERLSYKEQFDTIYHQLNCQPHQQKPDATPQGDNQPVTDAPIPPDPDNDKNRHKNGQDKSNNKQAEGNNLLNQTKEQLLKSKKSYEKIIAEHIEKLAQYKKHPDLYDNKNLLKNVTKNIREQIINGRIEFLENEINRQISELEKITALLVK